MKQTELTPQEAYARLASYCAQAERSPSDLRRRMQRLELAEELQAELLTRLEREGFVSGERFARASTAGARAALSTSYASTASPPP